MDRVEILKEIRRIIKGIAPECCSDFSKIDEQTELVNELKFDSMSYLMLASSLEEKYDLTLTKEDALKLIRVSDIINLIINK